MPGVRHIACAISGGVDSAVAALLLKRQGYRVSGVFMRNWDVRDEVGLCQADRDQSDAQEVCQHLNIPFHEVSFVKEYWNDVFSKLVHGYENGMTPNPDVLCNRHVKFNAFMKYAKNVLGADAMATGHYAQSTLMMQPDNDNPIQSNKGVKLLQAADSAKDQTLFLCQISQAALQYTLFPVGHLIKHQVKRIAANAGMEKTAKRKESVGVCFIGKRNFHNFIEEYVEPRPGPFIDIETGSVVGQHKGAHYWTLGQRTHIGGQQKAYFVAGINPDTKEVLVAAGTDHPALFSHSCFVKSPHWINGSPDELIQNRNINLEFRYQHTHPLTDCTVTVTEEPDVYEVFYPQSLRAVSPGQYAVFYQGEVCLGGAQILRTGPSLYEIGKAVQYSKEYR